MKKIFLIAALLMAGSFFGQEKVIENEKEEAKQDSVPAAKYIISEEVPSFPGCTGNNLEKRRCTDINIRKFIARNFNVQRAKCLEFVKKYDRKLKKHIDVCKKEIKNERVRIKTIFVIDTLGYITDIKAQSPYPNLNKEAKRVLRSLPVMNPGIQRGRKVKVRMAVPIQFKIQ